MITVEAKTGNEYSLIVTGHSGYAEPGQDIVCAAVTILAYVAANAVIRLENAGGTAEQPEVALGSGSAVIRCKEKATSFGNLDKVWAAVMDTYQLIADYYPENVKII